MKKIGSAIVILVLSAGAALFAPGRGKAETAATSASRPSSAAAAQKGSSVLVAYFTWPEPDGVDASSGASRVVADGKLYGNTEYVARMIAEAAGGDLFAIETEKKYPSPHKPLIDEAKREAEANERPRLTTHIKNPEEYDVVFVGYPNWWYDMPMVIYSFFDEYDFSGKTVIPFVTHGGSRFSQSVKTISELEKNARVVEGPSIPARSAGESRAAVETWLQRQGLLKK